MPLGSWGWGGPCVVDVETGLTRVAFLNVNPTVLSPQSEQERQLVIQYLVHELMHIVGFTPMVWGQTWGADRDPRLFDRRYEQGWRAEFDQGVRSYVERHTGCDSALTNFTTDPSVWFEDSDTGSALHWEKRLFLGEVMTNLDPALDLGPLILSELTVSYFEAMQSVSTFPISTTYVRVTRQRAGQLHWGRDKGCAWIGRTCRHLVGNVSYPEFCTEVVGDDRTCVFHRQARGDCNYQALTVTVPPGDGQPFDSPLLGSTSVEMGNCPVVAPKVYCNDIRNTPAVAAFETFGPSSRCIDTKLYRGICLPVCCGPAEDGGWRVYIDVPHRFTGQHEAVACREDGAYGGYGLQSSVLTEHWGEIYCPDAEEICGITGPLDVEDTSGIRWFDMRPEVHDVGVRDTEILVDVGLSVAAGLDANLTITFPVGGYWPAVDGPVRIEAVLPEDPFRSQGPLGGFTRTPIAFWGGGTLSVLFDSVRHCDIHTWRIWNMTTPGHRGDYGLYTLQLSANGTTYAETQFNPAGDDMKYTRVTATTTNTVTPPPTTTPLATPTLTPPPTPTLSASPTFTKTLGKRTTTIIYTPSHTATTTYMPPLPCYCYGHGNCVNDPYPFPYPDPQRVLSSCACELGYGGRFCQLETCGQKTCGKWGTCSALEPNISMPQLHFRGSTGRSPNPSRRPTWWMLDPDQGRALRTPYVPSSRWAPDGTGWSRDGFFDGDAGVDGLGWFHLCPDTWHLDQLNMSEYDSAEVAAGRFRRAPFWCQPVRAHGNNPVGVMKSEDIAIGNAVYNVTSGWLSRGLWVLTANLTNATESANLTFAAQGASRLYVDNVTGFTWYEVPPEYPVRHEVFDERNFTKARLIFAGDYASDSRTEYGTKTVDFAMDVDARRLRFWDPYFQAYRHRYGATPYPRRVRAHWNRDREGLTPTVAHVLVPGSVLEWLQIFREEDYRRPLTQSLRKDQVPDREIVMGEALWSQHLFVGIGGPHEAVKTVDYVLDNLLTDKAFTCDCITNTSGGVPVFVDTSDPRCEQCMAFATGTRAYPPGDCTLGCPCENGGQCDPTGRCQCGSHFEGPVCQHCKPGWYPVRECHTYCDPLETCLGRGICDGLGRCVCSDAFSGRRCETSHCVSDLQLAHHKVYQCNNPAVCTSEMNCGKSPLGLAKCWANQTTPPIGYLQWATGANQPGQIGFYAQAPGGGQSAFVPHRDWDERSMTWLDGGWDTFDGWGNFSVCTDPDLCMPITGMDGAGHGAPADPQGWRQGTELGWHPNITVRMLSFGASQIQLRHGWINERVFVLTAELDYGPEVWLSFGGRYGGARDVRYRGPTRHLRHLSFDAKEADAELAVYTRVVEQPGGRPHVAMAVSMPTANSRIGRTPLRVVRDGSGSETINTQRLVAGEGSPITVMVTWGEGMADPGFEQHLARAAAALSLASWGARCVRCPDGNQVVYHQRGADARGGTWCDKCRATHFPPPATRWNPPNLMDPASFKHDIHACTKTCNCSAPDDGATCDSDGNCECGGRRAGKRCTECQPHWFPWPQCDTYCHPLYTCSGHGTCMPDSGRCGCTAGFQGYSCQLQKCQPADCGVVEHGRAVCASPLDAPFRLLWIIGKRDGSNAEFQRPLLRSVEQGAVTFNLSTMKHTSLPGVFSGPDLGRKDNAFGLAPDEFNPLSVYFRLPDRGAVGFCWLIPAGGEGHYQNHIVSQEKCLQEGGRWDSAWWCYDTIQQRFVFYDNPETECSIINLGIDRSHEVRLRAFQTGTSTLKLSLGMFAPLGAVDQSMLGAVTINGKRVYRIVSRTFDEEIDVPYDWLRWGGVEDNLLHVLFVRGGEIRLDYIQLSSSVLSTVTTATSAFADQSLRKLMPDPSLAAYLNFDNKFRIAVDLRREAASGLQYFAVGGGLGGLQTPARYAQTFDHYGDIRVCLDDDPVCADLHLNDGSSLLDWHFDLGGTKWMLRSGFVVPGIYMCHVRQLTGKDRGFSFRFGGAYAYSNVPRQYGEFNQRAVFNNYPFVIPCMWNSPGPRDNLEGNPQLFVAVLPYDANGTSHEYWAADETVRIQVRRKASSRAEGTEHRLEEYVRVLGLSKGATLFMQWGFAKGDAVLQYIFAMLDTLQRPTCSCMAPFTGPECGQCAYGDPGKSFCDFQQCFVQELCGCPYPSITAPDCHSEDCMCGACLPGYIQTQSDFGTDLVCQPDCSSVGNCSKRGLCSVPGVCKCYPGFYGEKCDVTMACLQECSGDATDSRFGNCTVSSCYLAPRPGQDVVTAVCPYGCKRGTCDTVRRQCVCDPGWFGLDCAQPACLGGSDCYGHGLCVGTQRCSCRAGWVGANCETSNCSLLSGCSECTAAEGCGWCALTGTCLPGDRSGPYTPVGEDKIPVTIHSCTAEPAHWRLSECYMGQELGVRYPPGVLGVPVINCSIVCSMGSAEQCTLCGEITPSGTGVTRMMGERHLLQTAPTATLVIGPPTATVRPATTTRLPVTTTVPVLTAAAECEQRWSRFNGWMWDGLVENHICACTLELTYGRDVYGTCMSDYIWGQLGRMPRNLTDQAAAQRALYSRALVTVDQQKTCCSAGDACCQWGPNGEFTALRAAESVAAAAVDWYAERMIPLHLAAYEGARRHCGCSTLCVSHQRESIWRMLMQAVPPCTVGSPANVVLHPCELESAEELRRQLQPHFTPKTLPRRCAMDERRVQRPLSFASSRAQEVSLTTAGQYDLPTCAHWATETLWACCSTLLSCYASCSSETHRCNNDFVECVMDRYRCTALLGVKQLTAGVPEESVGALRLNVEMSFFYEPELRRLACQCERIGAGCAHGVRISGSCLCFEGWIEDHTGQCLLPSCPGQCSGHGTCVHSGEGVSVCQCDHQWEGVSCATPSWAVLRAHGLGHVETWDGARFRFYGDGTFLLCHLDTPSGEMDIQVHEAYDTATGTSAIDGVSVRLGSNQVDVWTKAPTRACVGTPARRAACRRGQMLVRVNGQPLTEPFDYRLWAWPELVLYSVRRFHDVNLFIRLPSLVKLKVGVVWSEIWGRHFLNVVVSTQGHRIRGGGRTEGLCGSFDGDPRNDVSGWERPDGSRTKDVWADYHAQGERWRVPSEATIMPFPWTGPSAESLVPPKHAYWVPVNVSRIPAVVLRCEAVAQPYRADCELDSFLVNDTALSDNEFLDAVSYCRGPSGLQECSLNGACDPFGGEPRCLCPAPINASAECADRQELVPVNVTGTWEQLRRLTLKPELFYGPNEWGPWHPGQLGGPTSRRAESAEHQELQMQHDTTHPHCWTLNFCSGHGLCVAAGTPDTPAANSSIPACVCSEGWSAARCDEPSCPDGCGLHGVCTAHYGPGIKPWDASIMDDDRGDSPDGGCRCRIGYNGSGCTAAARCPLARDCNGHGVCRSETSCLCYTGWTGAACDREEPGHCSVTSQLGGRWCTVPQCDCSGHGLCSIVQGSRQCVCDQNWFGESCSKTCVAAVTCTGHGTCDSNGQCVCVTPWRTSTCEIVNPLAPTSVTVTLVSKPATHPQGTDMHLNALVNGGRVLPTEGARRMYLQWVSVPEGLFPPETQDQLSVRVQADAWSCSGRQGITSTDILGVCRYVIRLEIYSGLSLRNQDSFTVQVNTAPTHICPPRYGGRCTLLRLDNSELPAQALQGSQAAAVESFTQVTLEAGAWRDEQVPFLYRFAYRVAGVEQAIQGEKKLGFQPNPYIELEMPTLPCGSTQDVTEISFYVYVQDSGGAVSSMVLPVSFTQAGNATPTPVTVVLVQRMADEEGVERLRRTAMEPRTPSPNYQICGSPTWIPAMSLNQISGVLRLVQRRPVQEWDWELVRWAVSSVLLQFSEPGSAESSEGQEFLVEILNDVMELRVMANQPDKAVSCGLQSASSGNASSGQTQTSDQYSYMTSYLSCAGKDISDLIVASGELSTLVANTMLETVSRMQVFAEQAALTERLQGIVEADVSSSKVDLQIIGTVTPRTPYSIHEGIVFPLNATGFPGEGQTLVLGYVDTQQRVYGGEYRALDGIVRNFSISLASAVYSFHFRDHHTGVAVPVASNDPGSPLAVVAFTLATDILWARGRGTDSGYRCVFWENGKWQWGQQLGVSEVVPASSIDRGVIAGPQAVLTYGCAVSHLSMWALADVNMQVAAATAPPGSTPAPPNQTLPPQAGTGGYTLPPAKTAALTNSAVLALALGLGFGTVVIVTIGMCISISRHRRKKKREAAELAALRYGQFWKHKALKGKKKGKGRKAVTFGGAAAGRRSAAPQVPEHMVDNARAKQRTLLARLDQGAQGMTDEPEEDTGPEEELDEHGLPIAPPPDELRRDITKDQYLAQRDQEQIEQVLDMADLHFYDPTKPIGNRRFAYPVEGDSASEDADDYEDDEGWAADDQDGDGCGAADAAPDWEASRKSHRGTTFGASHRGTTFGGHRGTVVPSAPPVSAFAGAGGPKRHTRVRVGIQEPPA
eukprot:TRINITY_DN10538_c0_g1_i13.p1 TRINITY_DN10538_c0_g1~~TRINITY_DN10538_c0_g1_i13.p1  ORF type:complete len:4425 (+),score=947.12 TRINITY_DN10538_c0_g1_i13:5444-18718(+)